MGGHAQSYLILSVCSRSWTQCSHQHVPNLGHRATVRLRSSSYPLLSPQLKALLHPPHCRYVRLVNLEPATFTYSDSVAAAIAGMCARPTVQCSTWGQSGIPPVSCTAFGDGYALIHPERTQCLFCPDPSDIVASWWILFGGYVLLLGLYVASARISLARIGWCQRIEKEEATYAKV